MLPTPGFHHLHLNSVDPDRAIEFYTRQFPSTAKRRWGGLPALKSPNSVLVLFTKVDAPPPTEPQSAIWHFGWHVIDARYNLATYQARPEVQLLPLYTTDEGGWVLISSDTWPSVGGVLGLTKAQITDAKAKGVRPAGGGGFAYMKGPDDALVEYAGNHPAERFNHVHLYQEDPIAALEWYQRHLNAPLRPGYAPHLAGAEPGGNVPLTARRGRVRRRVDDVVREPGRDTIGRLARPIAGPHRAERGRSRRLGRQARQRRRRLARTALPARRHPRPDDRRPQPRSDRAGRGEIAQAI